MCGRAPVIDAPVIDVFGVTLDLVAVTALQPARVPFTELWPTAPVSPTVVEAGDAGRAALGHMPSAGAARQIGSPSGDGIGNVFIGLSHDGHLFALARSDRTLPDPTLTTDTYVRNVAR